MAGTRGFYADRINFHALFGTRNREAIPVEALDRDRTDTFTAVCSDDSLTSQVGNTSPQQAGQERYPCHKVLGMPQEGGQMSNEASDR